MCNNPLVATPDETVQLPANAKILRHHRQMSSAHRLSSSSMVFKNISCFVSCRETCQILQKMRTEDQLSIDTALTSGRMTMFFLPAERRSNITSLIAKSNFSLAVNTNNKHSRKINSARALISQHHQQYCSTAFPQASKFYRLRHLHTTTETAEINLTFGNVVVRMLNC